MRSIDYHIAVTLDGFISHVDGSIDGFLMQGPHADDFAQSLANYDTVLMGRKTYEFGFQFGLTPGQPAYPNMHHHVFSNTLQFDSSESVTLVDSNVIDTVNRLKQTDGGDIWLCGGDELAGHLLDQGLIDKLTVKVNPVLFGAGRKLFGSCNNAAELNLIGGKTYENGVVVNRYRLVR